MLRGWVEKSRNRDLGRWGKQCLRKDGTRCTKERKGGKDVSFETGKNVERGKGSQAGGGASPARRAWLEGPPAETGRVEAGGGASLMVIFRRREGREEGES